jgi:hypothetical protein
MFRIPKSLMALHAILRTSKGNTSFTRKRSIMPTITVMIIQSLSSTNPRLVTSVVATSM